MAGGARPEDGTALGETAVPVFLGSFDGAVTGVPAVADHAEFTALVGDARAASLFGRAVRGWFTAGGGRCRLVDVTGRTPVRVLAEVAEHPDVTLLLAPALWEEGAESAGVWARALAEHAAAHGAMAVLHADREHSPEEAAAAWRAWGLPAGTRSHVALYHPWLRVPEDADAAGPAGRELVVPPSPAAAGSWARVDRERGVWHGPLLVPIAGVLGPEYEVTDGQQRDHTPVNFVRTVVGSSVMAAGARTLAPELDEDWRYIAVRRLVDSLSREIALTVRAVAVAVGPDTPAGRREVRLSIESCLRSLWERGALRGETETEAYRVEFGTDAADRPVARTWIAPIAPRDFLVVEHSLEPASDPAPRA
ncbi:phage tail sheath family protein (plasmid) [Streptomyces sp. BI20]|uniref:phage tail sheath family protein n=1 Tax=Streptomyces sp. BI20 TaxID=3403460 RepID=UPI003C78509A